MQVGRHSSVHVQEEGGKSNTWAFTSDVRRTLWIIKPWVLMEDIDSFLYCVKSLCLYYFANPKHSDIFTNVLKLGSNSEGC